MNTNTETEKIFELKDVHYAYQDKIPALSGVSMYVDQGEILAVLGSNGSGKSSLLKILDGLYFPISGSVKAFGEDLTETALRDWAFNFAFRSKVGLVFQDSDVQLFMPTVWEEITFGPLQLGLDNAEVTRRLESALQALHIDHLRDRAPHQLSGGEKKKVALASILSIAPQVWLLDEPTAGLDPRTTAWLIEFLKAQSLAGSTVVIATHDLRLIETLAHRVYILSEEHQITVSGSPSQILSNRDLLEKNNLC